MGLSVRLPDSFIFFDGAYNTPSSREDSMEETVIHPTMKFIRLGYAGALLVIIFFALANLWWQWPVWLAWLSPLLLIWPLKSHLQNRMTRFAILEDKLRFDTGFLTK